MKNMFIAMVMTVVAFNASANGVTDYIAEFYNGTWFVDTTYEVTETKCPQITDEDVIVYNESNGYWD